ncbi:hypothetical protein F4859DRAFT_512045 [Xylaria cf. heliscus]|nr:hypothetical protein F4859DRAFT_512045 [Xylaria cf. heliscus]
MADEEAERGFNHGYVDESMIDPRLRSHVAETHGREYQTQSSASGLAPAPTLVSNAGPAPATAAHLPPTRAGPYDFILNEIDLGVEGEEVLPTSVYQSLDFIVGADHLVHDETERLWLIGVQAGIGLGIAGAREAVLNEMMNENTVFSRPIQSSPSDPSPYDMRMYLGQRCMTGFDLRVAGRISQQFVANSMRLIDIIVENGLTACLPEYGSPLPGTFAFFTDQDSARCHENSRAIDEAFQQAGIEIQPNVSADNGVGTGQPAPLTASFMAYSQFIGGHDMTRLTGTGALVANAVNDRNRVRYGDPAMPNQQYMAGRSRPEPHFTGDAQLSGDQGNNRQGHWASHAWNQPLARTEQAQGTTRVTQPVRGRRGKRTATRHVPYFSSSSDEDPVDIPDPFSRPRPTLVETESGRAVIRTVRQRQRKR